MQNTLYNISSPQFLQKTITASSKALNLKPGLLDAAMAANFGHITLLSMEILFRFNPKLPRQDIKVKPRDIQNNSTLNCSTTQNKTNNTLGSQSTHCVQNITEMIASIGSDKTEDDDDIIKHSISKIQVAVLQ